MGFDLVKRDYYSPVPDVAALPRELWRRPSALAGLELDLAGQMAFLEEELAGPLAEFRPPRSSTGTPGEYYLDNDAFGSVDAELLYALTRRLGPTRVIEIGSGWSSLVIRDALAANALDGGQCEYRIIDPYPGSGSAFVGDARSELASAAELVEHSVTEVPLEDFGSLAAGDLLFVDSSHTVKTGGDVNRIVLDILPTLQPGVTVHFHDVFLPWEYPREWSADSEYYWAEQYLLQAFLAFNRSYEVVVAAHALSREFPDRLHDLIPSFDSTVCPGSFWVRRVD